MIRGYSTFKLKSRATSTFSSSTGRSSMTAAPPTGTGAPLAAAALAGAAALGGAYAPLPPAGAVEADVWN